MKSIYIIDDFFSRQGEEWYHLRAKLTGGITSRKTLLAFLPTLNEICDDFIELIKYKRDENNIVTNFQEFANLMGLEGKTIRSSSFFVIYYCG